MRLEVDNAAVGYGARCVLDGVTFTLDEGEIGCLLGPSAVGKTTVLRAIAGFERLQRGSIRADGQVLNDNGVWVLPERRQIGMVFQDHALLPHLSVFDNVRFGLFRQPRKRADARAHAMLELVGLGGMATRHPHELSGGQQQRVAVARALAPNRAWCCWTSPSPASTPTCASDWRWTCAPRSSTNASARCWSPIRSPRPSRWPTASA